MTGSTRAGLAALCCAGIVLSACQQTTVAKSRAPEATRSDYDPTRVDYAQVSNLLAQRADAVIEDDEDAFLATLDPGQPDLAEQQRVLFGNLRELAVEAMRYDLSRDSIVSPDPVPGEDPFFRPEVVEIVELPHTTLKPVANSVRMTFVKRGGNWFLGNETKGEDGESFDSPRERPWFGEAIAAATLGTTTVLIDRHDADKLPGLSRSVREDLRAAAERLGRKPQYRLLVDATSNGFAIGFSDLSDEEASAVTFPMLGYDREGYGFAGFAVKVNPEIVDAALAAPGLMLHELTHFLLARTAAGSPMWLQEGVAEWVGLFPNDFADPAYPVNVFTLNDVFDQDRLPITGTFNIDPSVSYVLSHAAVTFLVQERGIDRLVDLMLAYRKEYDGVDVDALTPRLLKRFYGMREEDVMIGAKGLLAELVG